MVFWSSTRWVDDINTSCVHTSDLSACTLLDVCATVVPVLKRIHCYTINTKYKM